MKLFLITLILNMLVLAGEKDILSAQQKMQQATVLAKARTLKEGNKQEAQPQEKELETVEPIELTLKEDENIVSENSETKTEVAMKEDIKTEEIFSKETSQSLFCKDTKQALREAEISEALSFYANSSYYQFNK